MISTPALMAEELPKNATLYERALASQVERLLELNIPIRDLWNPDKCPLEFLPYLAWSMSVDIWRTDWPEFKKRQAVRDAIGLHQIKGTEEALRRYVDQVDARVIQVVTPPLDFFAAADPSKEIFDEYVRILPQLRLYTGHDYGQVDGLFADEGFADHEFNTFDMGEALYGRRASLRQDGKDTDLKIVELDKYDVETATFDIERVSVEGEAGLAFFADASFADEGYADAVKLEARLFTIQLNRSYRHEESILRLSTVEPSLDPVNPRYERATDTADIDGGFYADHSFSDDSYWLRDRGGELMFDRLYLFDPNIPTPLAGPGGFADHTRIGMDAFTAEVLIDAGRVSGKSEAFAEGFFADHGYATDDELQKIEDTFEAINASKSLTDTVLVSFETTRAITLNDGFDLNKGVNFEERVPRHI